MIKEVVEAIEERLLISLSDMGEGNIPSFALGENELAAADSTPRIVFVPHGGSIRLAKKNGGDFIGNPGALWERNVQLSAHIWADSITETEELANELVAAIHWVAVGSYAIVGETWDTKGTTDEGLVCVLDFQLRMPFTRSRLGQVKPTILPPLTTHIEAQ